MPWMYSIDLQKLHFVHGLPAKSLCGLNDRMDWIEPVNDMSYHACDVCARTVNAISASTSHESEQNKYKPVVLKEYDFERLGREMGELVREKNDAYGDSFARCGDFLRMLYPNGVRPEQYDDLGGMFRIFDKLFRIATDKDAFGESPWRDIIGYGLLETAIGEVRGQHSPS